MQPLLLIVLLWPLLAQADTTALSESGQPGDRSPEVLLDTCPRPTYPEAARRAGQEGTTVLKFQISAEGVITKTEIAQSSGFQRLDDVAVEALSKCAFQPAIVKGQRVPAWAQIKYKWKLDDSYLPRQFTIGPNLSTCPVLKEPEDAPKRSLSVTTRIRMEFLRNGKVRTVSVESPSGSKTLDNLALTAYSQCAFDPKLLVALPNTSPPIAMPFVSTAIMEDNWPPTEPSGKP